MRRVVFIALTIVVVLGAAGASWAEEAGGTKPIQIALFSPVQIVPETVAAGCPRHKEVDNFRPLLRRRR